VHEIKTAIRPISGLAVSALLLDDFGDFGGVGEGDLGESEPRQQATKQETIYWAF
jgi:hypothetical protein